MLRNIIWMKVVYGHFIETLRCFQEKNLRLFEQCCEIRYPSNSERVSILLPRRKPPVPKGSPWEGFGGGGPSNIFNCWYGRRKKFFSFTSIYLAQVEKIHWQKTEENTDYWESNNNTTKLRHMEFVSFNWSRGATARTTYCISRTMVQFH